MTANPIKFPQVEHADASGALAETYEDIEATLRVAWVAFGCRVLAAFPGFLPTAFRLARPHFSTRHAERAADSLRRHALLPGPGLRDPRPALLAAGWTPARIRELVTVLDAFNYGNPKYLLLITAWSEAIQGRHPSGPPLAPDAAAAIPRGRPPEVPSMHHMIEEDRAGAAVRDLYRRITDLHFHHGPSSDYRVLANYPDYLSMALDDCIAPIVRTPAYDARQRDLIQEARDWVRTLPAPAGPGPDQLAATCSPRDVAGLTGLLFMYQRFIADITIDILRLKQAFDGAEAAASSPFPIA
jgi:hypothetical protein